MSVVGYISTSFLSFDGTGFFFGGFQSLGMFTTLVVGLFYYYFSESNRKCLEMSDIIKEHRFLITFAFFFFLFGEIIPGILSIFRFDTILAIIISNVGLGILYVPISFFVIREKRRFYNYVHAKSLKPSETNETSDTLRKICERAGRWLVFSSCFMLISTITFFVWTQPIVFTPNGFLSCSFLSFFSRWGVSFTQIMALRWQPQQFHQNKKTKSLF
eukprot:c10940_g1_i1.p1 GENE.c10940_g1_i1~~c10940_g1_i1.p1  ORF type:complete len:216 (+),score=44.04 c10940_g1_i1:167-814(+)